MHIIPYLPGNATLRKLSVSVYNVKQLRNNRLTCPEGSKNPLECELRKKPQYLIFKANLRKGCLLSKYFVVDELGLHDKDYYSHSHVYLYFTISDEKHNCSSHNYEIIGETDPYYSNIEECDVLSNFRQDIGLAGHTTIDEGMTTSASNYSVQPTRLLDMSEVDIHPLPANGVGSSKHVLKIKQL